MPTAPHEQGVNCVVVAWQILRILAVAMTGQCWTPKGYTAIVGSCDSDAPESHSLGSDMEHHELHLLVPLNDDGIVSRHDALHAPPCMYRSIQP